MAENGTAVIHARAQANEIPMDDAVEILRILETKPIDIVWWKAKDEEITMTLSPSSKNAGDIYLKTSAILHGK